MSLLTSIGAGAGQALKQIAAGAASGGGFGLTTPRGRAAGGFGVAGGRRRRGRGISAAELRGFRKINRLLHDVGMRPKATHHKGRR